MTNEARNRLEGKAETREEREAIDEQYRAQFVRCPVCGLLYLPQNGHTTQQCVESARSIAELRACKL